MQNAATPLFSTADPWMESPKECVSHDAQRHTRGQIAALMHVLCSEGSQQMSSLLADGMDVSRAAHQESQSFLRQFRYFLSQPVWIPGRARPRKTYKRGTLFLIDTVRFGSTFAVIFLTLFAALNYQSFWTIAQAYVAPMIAVTTPAAHSLADNGDVSHIQGTTSVVVTPDHGMSMLDLLPPVGPPDDRIIIPKLQLNVPIVHPPRSALLAEDWKQLEHDIQQALQDGVVHYPGTAAPGQAGNFFITGHSSYFPWAEGSFKSIFARLHELQVGDEYRVYYGGDEFRYVIREKKEIRPSDVSVLDQPLDQRIGTLMTCTPVGTTLRRLIIVSQEVDPHTGEVLAVGERQTHTDSTPALRLDMLPI